MLESITQELVSQSIDRFWECIPSAWSHVRTNLNEIASENFDISYEQFTILRHIRRGRKSISELADVKQISRPAISQSVDLLVDRGLISRKQNTQDRRWVELELTQNGNEMLNTIYEKNGEWMEQKLSVLSQDELRFLLSGLEALKKTFDK